jgi:SAM-dependent methyltransferase
MASWPGVADYKRRTHQLLSGCDSMVDVGCGPGDDVLALGVERCVGVDRSAAMCARARKRGAVVVQADVASLPFENTTFSGARTDRTLQHVADPQAAVGELLRVLRPGAPLVVADPDQESLVIQVPGVRQSVLDRLKALRRDVGYRNGHWISKAPAVLDGAGAEVTSVEAFPVVLRDPTEAFGLPSWPVLWRRRGRFTDEELAEWNAAMAERKPGFLYCVTFIVVVGRKR